MTKRRRFRRPREVFLSHAGKDRRFAGKIARLLRNVGIPVWYSRTNIHGAAQWHDEIGKALGRCDWFVLILTPHAVDSMWVKRELVYALNNRRYENKIVPLLRKPCRHARLSWALQEFQFVDFSKDFDKGCRALLRVWKLGNSALAQDEKKKGQEK